jgi:hypothetical protein
MLHPTDGLNLRSADIHAILKTIDLIDRKGVEASLAVGRKCLSANPQPNLAAVCDTAEAWKRDHPAP